MKRLLRFCFLPVLSMLMATLGRAQVTADFTMSYPNPCAPVLVSFAAVTTGNPAGTTYAWTFGTSSPVAGSTATHTYSTPGTYYITLTATNGSNSDSKTDSVYISGKPAISLSAPQTTVCAGTAVNFSASITANGKLPLSYSWIFGDGGTNNTDPPPLSHTYMTAGTYTAILQVSNYDCPNLDTLKIIVNANPVASFSVDKRDLCKVPATVTFTNTSSGKSPFTTSWIFGDGSPNGSGALTQTHTYTAGGPYTVTMTTTDANGCPGTRTEQAYISTYTTTPSFTITNSGTKCQNDAITFTNTTPGTNGAIWDFGDGITGSGQTTSHAYTAAGTYPIRMITNVGPCADTLFQSYTVDPNPVTTIGFTPLRPCPASAIVPSPVTYTATTTGSAAYTYQWKFDDGGVGSGNPITHNYTTNGYKSDTLITTNPATGCKSTTLLTDVPINKLKVVITADPPAGCIPLTSHFSVNLFGSLPPPPPMAPDPPYPDPANSWYWSFNNVLPPPDTSTLSNPSYTWSSVGNYGIKVVITTPNGVNGCKDSATVSVHADVPVTPNFTAGPDTVVCPKELVTFTNLTPNVPDVKYTWFLGDSDFFVPNRIASFKHGYRKPGTYGVTVRTDHLGCPDSLIKDPYITVNPSNADFDMVTECFPSYKVTFYDSSIGATSWNWDFGDGSPISTLKNPPPHTYATTGTYQVRLATSNSTFGCRDTIIKPVVIFRPALTLAADRLAICKDETVNFTGTFNAPSSISYAWLFDNNPVTTYKNDPTASFTYNTRGTHSVRVVAISGNSNNCYDTSAVTNILVSQPIVGFTASPLLGCAPLRVTFTDTSKGVPGSRITARSWDYGNGIVTPVTSTTTTNIYNTPGLNTVKLYILDSVGCRDSMVRPNYVEVRKPVADFTSRTTVCANDSLAFTNSSFGTTALRYLWDFGDGSPTSTLTNPKHLYTKAGIYTVSLKASDITPCDSTITRSISVLAPTASFTKDKTYSVCSVPPMLVHYTNTSTGAVSYSWDLGQGNTFPGAGPMQASYVAPGRYNIVLTATDANGCTSIARDSVFVLGYNGAFTYTPADGCLPQTVSFTAVVNNIPQIDWDFGDNTSTTTHNASTTTHTYTAPGTYHPVVIYSDGAACKSFDSGLISIRVDQVKANFSTSVPCVGAPFTLSDASTALFNNPDNWRWFFTATDSASGANPSYTFGTAGNHPVKLIATSSWGCTDSITKDVFINPLPNIDAGPPDTGICPGDQITLFGHGGISYVWSPANLVSCTACDSTQVSSAAPTTYYVAGTDINGCVNKDSITAHIQIQTTTAVKPGGDICLGESYRLEASGATVYSWTPVRFLDSPNIANPLATPIITTTYVLESKEGTCLVHYDSITVVVHPLPYFDAGNDELINYGSFITLHPTTTGIRTIDWRSDSTLSCLSCFNPTAHPSFTTTYFAKATSDFGCVATDSVTVRVRCNGDSVFIPNTFTPNGDGLNDYFFPRGKGIDHMSSFRVYNRWGELIFERFNLPINDERSGWDGTFKGSQLPPDVYVYTMSTRCASGEAVEWKGDITLVR